MKQYKYLFIITFVISSFLFINNVSADYTAKVLNPTGASCSLKDGSTGYCYYENSNLDKYVGSVVWLDTGDEVTVLTDYETVPTQDPNICKDYYVYTSYYFINKKKTYNGYYCNANLTTGALTEELKIEFTNLGFPESYFEDLAILKTAHPNWEFKAINTKLDFYEAVKSLNIADKSLVQLSASNNYAYLATDSASFDYYNDKYIPYDSIGSSNAWYNANYDTIAYYLDPRNFLMDMYIFQFEGLKYEDSLTDEELFTTISSVFKDDYLSKFTNDFITAGKESKVNPVYLATLSKQEVGGSSTPTSAICGTIEGYESIYNFYNIGASNGENPVLRGLTFAKGTDELIQRPWDTEYKAIVGGALWIYNHYLGYGQDTSYLKKWNVVYNYLKEQGIVTNPFSNFSHQYMSNIMAPSSEARTTYKSYYKTGILDSKFTFYIPVFDNMPEVTNLPTKTGWPNNYLSKLIIDNKEVAGFNSETEKYNYYLDINAEKIFIDAKSISDKATISGIGEFIITDDLNKVNIDVATSSEEINKNILLIEDIDNQKIINHVVKVTAENKDIKEYKINIILSGEKVEEAIDIQTTMNNSGIKNNDKYLSGFEIGTDISFIKNKINNANGKAKIELKDSVNNEKTTGKLATGDKVTVTANEESKQYEVVIYGDANGDGDINAVDYVRIRKYIMNTANLSGSYLESSDVNKDGNVDAIDYVRIRKYIMNTASIEQ